MPIDIKTAMGEIQSGNMGESPLKEGLYEAFLDGVDAKKDRNNNDMFVVSVKTKKSDTPGMSGRDIKVFFGMAYASGVKQLLRLLMQAGIDPSKFDQGDEKMRDIKKALNKVQLESPDCEVRISYRLDRKTGEPVTDDRGFPRTNAEIATCDQVFKEFTLDVEEAKPEPKKEKAAAPIPTDVPAPVVPVYFLTLPCIAFIIASYAGPLTIPFVTSSQKASTKPVGTPASTW